MLKTCSDLIGNLVNEQASTGEKHTLFKVHLLGAERAWGWIGADQRCPVLALLSLGYSPSSRGCAAKGDSPPGVQQGRVRLQKHFLP